MNGNQEQDIIFAYDVAGQWVKAPLANGTMATCGYDVAGESLRLPIK